MDVKELQQKLNGVPLAGLRYYAETSSTNDIALQWIDEGAADGSLVVADFQSQGRGRMQRKWITTPSAALAFSLILKPQPESREGIHLYSPLGALALSQVLREQYHLNAQIKWPNDVLIQRRKTCGILTEASWIGQDIRGVVVGIGINIASDSIPPSDQVQFPVTCIENETGTKVDRWNLLKEVLTSLFAWRSRMTSPDFFNAWQANLAFVGEMVRIGGDSEPQIAGKMLGITPEGNLRVLRDDGSEVSVRVGDVHLRLAQPSV
jgi:BirA family biotin operon repressor/biotin-[acetyl-CoA-carboxylase] ligase